MRTVLLALAFVSSAVIAEPVKPLGAPAMILAPTDISAERYVSPTNKLEESRFDGYALDVATAFSQDYDTDKFDDTTETMFIEPEIHGFMPVTAYLAHSTVTELGWELGVFVVSKEGYIKSLLLLPPPEIIDEYDYVDRIATALRNRPLDKGDKLYVNQQNSHFSDKQRTKSLFSSAGFKFNDFNYELTINPSWRM